MNTSTKHRIMPKIITKDSLVMLKHEITASNYDTNGETNITVPRGTIGNITGGPSPYVNRPGSFYTVRFPQGRIAVTVSQIKAV